ncbi:MAG: YfhO family protein [Flavobacteriales bacterium]
MKFFDIKKYWSHIAAIVVFFVITSIYFYPAWQGYAVKMHDIETYKGMSKEAMDHKEFYGEDPLWTNSMFGGMPTTMIGVDQSSNPISFVFQAAKLWLPRPMDMFFLYMIGFYVLMRCLKINIWLSIIGSIAYAFSTYFIIIIGAGHVTKALALGFAPAILGGLIYTYRGRFLLGGAITALFLALQLMANHYQITYYLFFILFFVGLAEFSHALRSKKLLDFMKRTAVLVVAVLLAVTANYGGIKGTLDYTPQTTRGKSDLTLTMRGESSTNKTSGLDRDYITQWSYGTGETYTLLVPNAKGGGSGSLAGSKEFFESDVATPALKQFARENGLNTYWGNQPITSGPVYIGAIVILLAFLSIFFLEDRIKWSLIIASLLAVLLSWGKNFLGPTHYGVLFLMASIGASFFIRDTFKLILMGLAGIVLLLTWQEDSMGLTNFFIDHIPGYNKFRAVSMILVIVELCVPLLGVLLVQKLLDEREKIAAQFRLFLSASGVLIASMLIITAIPQSFFNFMSEQEVEAFDVERIVPMDAPNVMQMRMQYKAYLDPITTDLVNYRVSVFKADSYRSLFFVLLALSLLALYLKDKLKQGAMLAGIGVLITIDLWGVCVRYLDNNTEGQFSKWVPKEKYEFPYAPNAADMEIFESEASAEVKQTAQKRIDELRDKKRNYGASSISVTAEEQGAILFAELNKSTNFRVLNMGNPFNDGRTPYFHKSVGGYHGAKLKRYQEVIDFHLSRNNMNVLNMLNTKYFIDRDGQVRSNPGALGNAWFVGDVKWVENADEEMIQLDRVYRIKDLSGKNAVFVENTQATEAEVPAFRMIYLKYSAEEEGYPIDLNRLPISEGEKYTIGTDSVCDLAIPLDFLEEEGMMLEPKHIEIEVLTSFNPRQTALIRKSFEGKLGSVPSGITPTGSIRLENYKANHLTYKSKSEKDQLAVFSEIYYPTGWKAYIDGKEVGFAQANYLLRTLVVPAGEHTIEFKYSLSTYSIGAMFGYVALILILGIFGYVINFQKIKHG